MAKLKFNIKDSFKDKKFKYGGYATIMTAVVVAIVIIVNLVANQLDIKFDTSKNKLFSISDETKNIVKKAKKPIEITGLYQTADTSTYTIQMKEILDKYGDISKNIKVSYLDPVKHPEFAKGFKDSSQITQGSVVVKSGSKYKVIAQSDLYETSQDQSTGQTTVTGSLAEEKITQAIMYVEADKDATVYVLQGHEEKTLPSSAQQILENENYTVKDINLLTEQLTASSSNVLLVNAPQKDISQDEYNKVKDYLDKGGRILYFADWSKESTANFDKLLNYYGVNVQKAYILEGDQNHYIQQADFLIPNIQSQDIVNPLSSANRSVIIPDAQPVEETKLKAATIKVESLLKTTDSAFAKTGTEIKTATKEAGDLSGPFNIAVAVTNTVDANNTDKNGKMVVLGAPIDHILADEFNQYSSNTNQDFVLNSLGWLAEKQDNLTVRPKSYETEPLQISQSQALTIAGISVILIPALVAIGGVSVWLRRRHL